MEPLRAVKMGKQVWHSSTAQADHRDIAVVLLVPVEVLTECLHSSGSVGGSDVDSTTAGHSKKGEVEPKKVLKKVHV